MEEHLQVLFQVEGNFPPLYWSESIREKKTHTQKNQTQPPPPQTRAFGEAALYFFFPDKKIH